MKMCLINKFAVFVFIFYVVVRINCGLKGNEDKPHLNVLLILGKYRKNYCTF